VTDDGTTTIYGFTISATDGSLTLISGAPFSFAGGLTGAQEIVIDHTGNYLYVTNNLGNTVSAYVIDQTPGALSAHPTTPTAFTGNGPQFAAMDPSGTHLYVANSLDNTVTIIPIAADGAMGTPVTTAVITGAVNISAVVVDPAGTHLYVLDSGAATGQVYGSALNNNTFDPTAPITATPIGAGQFPFYNVIIDPTGKLLATANNFDGPPGTISLYQIGSGGTLTADTPVNAGNSPTFVIFLNAP
jgi:6-phosphogluconolactonase (cycloisomerase 2 family)